MTAADSEKCPKCSLAFGRVEVEGFPASVCPGCSGIWLSRVFLESAVERHARAERLPRGSGLLYETVAEATDLSCPFCRTHRLETLRVRDVTVERCPECKGIFLDRGELDAIRSRAVAAARTKTGPGPAAPSAGSGTEAGKTGGALELGGLGLEVILGLLDLDL